MIEVLLAIIAACLLFGSAAVFGFLEAAFWLILFLAVVLIVVLVVRTVVKEAIGVIREAEESLRRPRHPEIRTPPNIAGVHFTDWEDYLDWANREGRWAEGTGVAQNGRAGSGEPEAVCELPPRTVVPADSCYIADDAADDVLNSLRRLRAVSVLSLPKGEFAEEAGRPMPPEIAAIVQILLRERPDLRDYIVDELWRKGWRVEGI